MIVQIVASGIENDDLNGVETAFDYNPVIPKYALFGHTCTEHQITTIKTGIPPYEFDLIKFNLYLTTSFKVDLSSVKYLIKDIIIAVKSLNDKYFQLIYYTNIVYYSILLMKQTTIVSNLCYADNGNVVYKTILPLYLGFDPDYIPTRSFPDDIKIDCTVNKRSFLVDFLSNLPKDTLSCIESFMDPIEILLKGEHVLLDTNERNVLKSDLELTQEYFYNVPRTIIRKGKESIVKLQSPIMSDIKRPVKYFIIHLTRTNGTPIIIDPLLKIEFMSYRKVVKSLDSAYMRVFDPLRQIGRELPKGMYLFSFSLDPSNHAPKGLLNLTRCDGKELHLFFSPFDIFEYKINITVCDLRVLHISDKNIIKYKYYPYYTYN